VSVVALGTQHAMQMRHTVICGLSGSTISIHTIPILEKLLNNVCVLIFSKTFLKIFLILRRTERDMIKIYVGLHVSNRYSCHILMELGFSRQIWAQIKFKT
jgi:hypothetical protein